MPEARPRSVRVAVFGTPAELTANQSLGRFHEPMTTIDAHITGTIWKVEVSIGDQVVEGDVVAIVESMKMEMPVESEVRGEIVEILCDEGQAVEEGQPIVRVLADRTAPNADMSRS
jgi:acetyl-CoA carboxylase biotin carboxyl carrier protein